MLMDHPHAWACPDCDTPICEECAGEAPVFLQHVFPPGVLAFGFGYDTWLFCLRCALAERLLFFEQTGGWDGLTLDAEIRLSAEGEGEG